MLSKMPKVFSYLLFFLPYISVAASIYPTDVVGRDLVAPLLGWAGHIGIATADKSWQEAHYVVEALNVPNHVLQINTLDDFKRRSPYWGAKFGINNNERSATKIINEGAFQASLKCAEYTWTAEWWAGTGQWGIPTKCAKFRCDTFVSYLYRWGGYTLPTYNPPTIIGLNPTFPRRVFNLFPYFRERGVNLRKLLTEEPLPKPSYTINDITEEQMYNIPFIEFTQAIDLPKKSLTKNGVDNILKFAGDPHLSDEKRVFLLDKLGFVCTVDMVPKLIELYYKNQENRGLAHMIIRDTQDLYQQEKLLADYPLEKQFLEDFYTTLLDKNMTREIAPIVVRGFISLTANETILAHKIKLDQLLDDNKIVETDVSLALKISLAFKSEELEELYIPNIISTLKKKNDMNLDTLFSGAVAANLANHGLSALQISSKIQISHYLSSIQSQFNNKNNKQLAIRNSITNRGIAIPQSSGMWLEASALVNAAS